MDKLTYSKFLVLSAWHSGMIASGLIVSFFLSFCLSFVLILFFFWGGYYHKKKMFRTREQTEAISVDGGDFNNSRTCTACVANKEIVYTLNQTEGTLAVMTTKA